MTHPLGHFAGEASHGTRLYMINEEEKDDEHTAVRLPRIGDRVGRPLGLLPGAHEHRRP
jgi:hypothetical protein